MNEKEAWFTHNRCYKVITLKWIKRKLTKAYLKDTSESSIHWIDCISRELIITKNNSNYGEVGYYVFGFNGSPPKGCAIFQPQNRFLIIVDAWGKTMRYKNILLEDSITKGE